MLFLMPTTPNPKQGPKHLLSLQEFLLSTISLFGTHQPSPFCFCGNYKVSFEKRIQLPCSYDIFPGMNNSPVVVKGSLGLKGYIRSVTQRLISFSVTFFVVSILKAFQNVLLYPNI